MPLTFSIDDEEKQLSIDVVELNNVVLTMNPLIKKAKVLVLREIESFIKRQKAKQSKAPQEKRKRIGRKIVNKLAEIRLLKKLSTIKLCKLVLANVNSVDMLEKGGESLSKQDRLVIRLAARPEISKYVNDFREKHSDWSSLVYYLLYKNTSGKWKTTEQKRKASKKRKGDLPFPIVDEEVVSDGQGASTLKKFKEFKEHHDREMIAAQRRLLEAEALAESNDDEDDEDESSDNSEADDAEVMAGAFNPATKAFISELLAKVDRGEDIDKELLPGNDLDNVDMDAGSKPTAAPAVTAEKGEAKQEKVKQSQQKEDPSSKAKKADTKVPKNRKADERGEVEEEAKTEKPAPAPKASSVDEDGILHEIIVEDTSEMDDPDAEGGILGSDDVEMRQELKTGKAKPGDGGMLKRIMRQRLQHRHPLSQGVARRGRGRAPQRGVRPGAPKNGPTEAPLHPSWEAKKRQKELLKLSAVGPAPAAKRIVFNEDD